MKLSAPPSADDFSVLGAEPQLASEDANTPHLQPVLLVKRPAHAAALVSSPSLQASQLQQVQQELVLISAQSSPAGAVRLLPPPAPADLHEATHWQQPQPQPQPQLQNHEQFAQYARFSIDVHTLVSGQSSTAAEVPWGPVGAEPCAKPLQPLAQDSLSAAAVTAGSFSSLTQAPVRLAGTQQPETQDSPSDNHSVTQADLKAASTSTSSSGSGRSSAPHPHGADAALLCRTSSPAHLQSSSTAGRVQLLAPAAATGGLQGQRSSSAARSNSSSSSGHHTSHSPVAGWHDGDLLTPLAAKQFQAGPAAPAATAAYGDAGDAATACDAAGDAATPPYGDAGDAAAACDGAGDAVQPEGCDDADCITLPSGLASKLHKWGSGCSFRMLQPGLSESLRASDCPLVELSGSGSSCTTPAAAATTAAASDSLPASATVSRRSTAGYSPRALQRVSLNPGGAGAAEGQVPATIHEHTVSISGPGGELVSTSAAVAAAFEADAAALRDLVEAAAAAAPQTKPQHSRSKSAGVISTPVSCPMPAATSAAAAAVATAAATAAGAGAGATRLTASALGEANASAGMTSPTTAAEAAAALLPLQRGVPRMLSVSSSPFAQAELQQAVAACLMSSRQHKQQPFPSTQATVPAAVNHAAGVAAAAVVDVAHNDKTPAQPSEPLPAAAAGSAASSSAAMATAPRRTSTSSSFRSLPYALTALHLHLQQQQQASPAEAEQRSMRPSMTSKLSWASTVAVIEPQAQLFALLNPEEAASTENPDSADISPSSRILRPLQVPVQPVKPEEGCAGKQQQQQQGRGSSSGAGGTGRQRGRGMWGLVRAQSSSSLFAGLKGPSSRPHSAAAAVASEAGPLPGSHTVAGDNGSSGSSSSSRSRDLRPAASAPSGQHVLRSILRWPSGTSSSSRPGIAGGTATPNSTAAGTAQCKQTQRNNSLDLQQGPRVGVSRRQGDMSSSMSHKHLPALPPLPRPAASPCTDAAAAAIAQHTASSSTSAAAAPAAAPAEGPFTVQHMQLLEDSTSACSSTGSVLLSSGKYGLRHQVSAASAPTQLLRETRSTGASSIGQLSSSGSSSGTGGSLMSLAVTRMHSVAGSPSNLAAAGSTAAAGQQLQISPQRSSSLPSLSSMAAAASSTSSSSSSAQVARAFAEAFLAALTAGDTKWASSDTVSQLLHETAKMVALDKQLYAGKAAIIRRLNGGMEQLVKMAQATGADSSSSSSNSRGDADDAAAAARTSIAAMAQKLPTPQLSIISPDPKGKPSQVEAVYTFKWGIRKFTMKDSFIVRGGQILRLRRTRG